MSRRNGSDYISTGAQAIRDALNNRLVFVEAPSGWGKTTAARAAVRDVRHLWCDLATAPSEKGSLAFALATLLSLPADSLGRMLSKCGERNGVREICSYLSSLVSDVDGIVVIDDVHLV